MARSSRSPLLHRLATHEGLQVATVAVYELSAWRHRCADVLPFVKAAERLVLREAGCPVDVVGRRHVEPAPAFRVRDLVWRSLDESDPEILLTT